jgi:hypothetical protein
MFVEIALVQRMSVFLGHPMYALGILLFTIIASSAVGSLLSVRLPLTRKPWFVIYPAAIAIIIIAVRFIMPLMGTWMMTSPMYLKIAASIVIIIPLGLFLGVAFPTGMQIVKTAWEGETPWYWAVNGTLGVLSSALAVFISILPVQSC